MKGQLKNSMNKCDVCGKWVNGNTHEYCEEIKVATLETRGYRFENPKTIRK